MYYSKKTNGFYVESVHNDNMPDDVVEISNETYQKLLSGNAAGNIIVSDDNGRPMLQAIPFLPQPNAAEFVAACKASLGGPSGIMALPSTAQSVCALAFAAVSTADWDDLQAYIATMDTQVSSAIYNDIKAAAATFNIPITL